MIGALLIELSFVGPLERWADKGRGILRKCSSPTHPTPHHGMDKGKTFVVAMGLKVGRGLWTEVLWDRLVRHLPNDINHETVYSSCRRIGQRHAGIKELPCQKQAKLAS